MVRLTLLVMILAGLVILTFIVMRTKRNLARLRLVNAEKERIGTELHVASRIQQSMLPQSHWRQDNVDIAGSLVPAREVGGDLFDYFVRNEKLFFCIGDVSGKGAASALRKQRQGHHHGLQEAVVYCIQWLAYHACHHEGCQSRW